MNEIDETLMNLKVKRYLTQHEYLELELEETKYMFDQYNKKFIKEYYNVDPTPQPKITLPENIELEDEIPLDDVSNQETSEEDTQLKKLYRLLSLKTHKDKHNDNNEEFLRVNKAYKEKNILKLFSYSIKYNVNVNKDIVTKCMSLFEQNINQMQSKIHDLKHTLAWQWCHADDAQKEVFKMAKF